MLKIILFGFCLRLAVCVPATTYTYLGEGECMDSNKKYALMFSWFRGSIANVKAVCTTLDWCYAVHGDDRSSEIITTHEKFDPLDPFGNGKTTFSMYEDVYFSGREWTVYDGNGYGSSGVAPITLDPRSGYACYVKNIDECQSGSDNCDASATCSNTDVSFDCICNAGYTGNGVTCTREWNDYPGYAASWAGGNPTRLYHWNRPDLTAALGRCKELCEGDASCYAVEWRQNVECRLFDYKPSVYIYTKYWTVSVDKRQGGAADESEFKTATGTFTKTSETFGDPDKSFSDPAKPFSDPAISFGGPAKPFGGPDKPFGDKKRVRSTIAGVGLAVVVVLLAIKVVRRRRGFAEVPSVSEV